MRANPQFPADFVTSTEEILNEKLHFFAVLDCKIISSLNYYIIRSSDY